MDKNNSSSFQPDSGHTAWILISSSLVFIMIPGVGLFYSGMANSKSALSLLILSFWSFAIVFIQWFFIGYSLSFSNSGNSFIGDFQNIFLRGLLSNSTGELQIPQIAFCLYQGMFASITPILFIGAGAERNRFLPTLIFVFIWTTIVYDPIVNWSWNENGWIYKLGGLDFAGGTPIHIAAGSTALAFAVIIGKRPYYNLESVPHNMSNVFIGTALIWFGWNGFNGGSTLGANTRASLTLIVTNLAASSGAVCWVILDYIYRGKNYSAFGFCCGVIAGLVAITPAAGFVSPASSLVFGCIGAIGCNFALDLKHLLKFDDTLDVFALHGIGGIIGNLLTAFFAQKSIANLDGTEINGGFFDGNWIQLAIQLADSAACFAYAFGISFGILYVMNWIPGLQLRVSFETEMRGLDRCEIEEGAYEHLLDLANMNRKVQRVQQNNNNEIFGIENYSFSSTFERNQTYPRTFVTTGL